MGHLLEAAGVIGLINATLALHYKKIPPSLHFNKPNPNIDFSKTSFYVNDKLQEWSSGTSPRRASVSSFGIGGTNAHVVLEEAPQTTSSSENLHILLLSAKSSAALQNMARNLGNHLLEHPSISLADVAYTLQQGRREFAFRAAFVGSDVKKMAQELLNFVPQEKLLREKPEVAFLFSNKDPHQEYLERFCLKSEGTSSSSRLFLENYMIANIWKEWGITPQVVIGMQEGEYVAACVSGIIDSEMGLLLMNESLLDRIDLHAPKIPFLSEFTGTWILDETSLENWPRGISGNCKFSSEKEAWLKGNRILLEVDQPFLSTLGKLWVKGIPIRWNNLFQQELFHRVSLPSYPFEKKRYWIEPTKEQEKTIVSTSLEVYLLNTWKEFLGCDVDLQSDFFVMGGDSLSAIQILAKIEKDLGVSLSLQTLYSSPKIVQLAPIISRKKEESSILVQLRAGSGIPLFLIHPIEGVVFCYKNLVENLSYKEGPIYGIQAPEGTSDLNSIEEIASLYIEAIRKISPKGPYYILGTSFGGIVAYEIARKLNNPTVFILDAIRPESSQDFLYDEVSLIVSLCELFEGRSVSREEVQRLSYEERVKKVLQNLGLDALPFSQQEKHFQQIKNHWQAFLNYRPKAYEGKILFFQAKERFFRLKDVSIADAWKNLAKEGLVVHEIPGTHVSMLRQPQVKTLAILLNGYL
jgi:thioesterase domain-containing protein/acyl carrier protein